MKLTTYPRISSSFALGTFCLSVLGCAAETADSASDGAVDSLGKRSAALEERGPVQVLRATRFPMSRYGSSWTNVSYTLLVNNLAYAKSVEILAQTPDGTWQSLPASYRTSVGNNQEIWEAHANLDSTRFYARYQVAGKTYLDNNNGHNYSMVGVGANLYNNTDVLLWAFPTDLSPESTSVGVSVTLRNIAYSKKVNLVYSTDHWMTVRSAPLRHSYIHVYGYGSAPSPNEANVEFWQGSAEIGADAQQVEYAVSYEANGQTYWDNAFGANYVEKRPGAPNVITTPRQPPPRDLADTSCAIRLTSLGTREVGTRGNYETDCSYRPSPDCMGRLMWFGQVRVSKEKAEANAQPFVRYRSTDDLNTWKETPASRAGTDVDGSVMYEFDFAAIRPGPDDRTQGIELIPFLRLADGSRLFDHNAHADPAANYRVGSLYREPGATETGWRYAEPNACSATRL